MGWHPIFGRRVAPTALWMSTTDVLFSNLGRLLRTVALSKLNQGGFYNILLFCRFDEEDKNEPFGFHVFPSCCHCCCCCCRAETCKDWRWWQATAQQVQAKLSINVLIKKKKETTNLSTQFLYILLYMYNYPDLNLTSAWREKVTWRHLAIITFSGALLPII